MPAKIRAVTVRTKSGAFAGHQRRHVDLLVTLAGTVTSLSRANVASTAAKFFSMTDWPFRA